MELKTYKRSPFPVEAIQVTEENLYEVADWCNGEIVPTENGSPYIQVRVHRALNVKHTRAFLTDWVTSSDTGYRVYTDRTFRNNFFEVIPPEEGVTNVFASRPPHESNDLCGEPVVDDDDIPEEVVKPKPSTRDKLGFNAPRDLMR